MSNSLHPMDCSSPGFSPWNSPGKNTGVGCHFLLQGILLTQGSKLSLLRSPALAGGFFTTTAARGGCQRSQKLDVLIVGSQRRPPRGHVCLVTEPCLTFCDLMDCSLPGSSVHGDSPGKNTGLGCHVLLQGIFPTQGSNPGLQPRSPALQVDSLRTEPPGKPQRGNSL